MGALMQTTTRAIGFAILAVACSSSAQEFRPEIPRVWEDAAVKDVELPLAQRGRSPRYMTADEYYKLKVRRIYRSYPVYVQGKEPPGYIESLKQQEPELIFDRSKLHTKEDWIRAGKIVFEADTVYESARLTSGGPKVRPGFSQFVSKEGILPGFAAGDYVIRQKGVVERGSLSCASCHTRLMPDGTFLEGAQGNKPDWVLTDFPSPRPPDRNFLDFLWINFGVPWIAPRADFERSMMALPHADQYAGVLSREGTSAIHPPHIPSLIGVQEIKYLDATGLSRHRSIGDLMRYAVINMGLDTLARYGDFQPATSQSASAGRNLQELDQRSDGTSRYALDRADGQGHRSTSRHLSLRRIRCPLAIPHRTGPEPPLPRLDRRSKLATPIDLKKLHTGSTRNIINRFSWEMAEQSENPSVLRSSLPPFKRHQDAKRIVG
jgi:hypothetical protein